MTVSLQDALAAGVQEMLAGKPEILAAYRASPEEFLQRMFPPVAPPVADWLRSIGTPHRMVEEMSTHWFGRAGISYFEMLQGDELRPAWEETEQRSEGGLLTIGSCPNGDDIVLDLKSGAVGYLTHEMPEDGTPLRNVMRVVAASLGDFVDGASKQRLPSDYYDD